MTTNQDTVLTFIAAWNTMDWDAACDLLSDDVIWHNIPMESIQGRESVEAAIRGMAPEGVDWEVISIAESGGENSSESGGKVLTERVDRFDMPGGKKINLPVMGTFELENGKITAWRDYFDLNTFMTQMS